MSELTDAGHTAGATRSGKWSVIRRVPAEPVVFGVALLARLWVVLGDGGPGGNFYYDPAVYYAAADALTHGRMPYHDYVLIHPPLIVLVTVPFAVLGRLTTDHTGFIASNLGYTVLSAVNAVLVLRVARRFGMSRGVAFAGAMFSALWIGSIGAEFLTRLEPLGNFVLLLALLALSRCRPGASWRMPLLCGVLLGCLLNVKIWWIVPVAVILFWQFVFERAARNALVMMAGAVAACLLIDLPFLLVAGRQMFRAIISAQLQRTSNGVSVHARIDKFSSVSQVFGGRFNADGIGSTWGLQLLVLGFCVLVVLSCAFAWRTSAGRMFVVMCVAEAVVFLSAQTWFYTYCDYLTVPLALTIAAAMPSLARAVAPAGVRQRIGVGVATALPVIAAITAIATFANGGLHMVPPFPGAAKLARGAAGLRCMTAESPMLLIELDALDRSFDGTCRNWVDLTGVMHGGGPDARDFVVPGRLNKSWRSDLCAYLTSGDAVVVAARGAIEGVSKACDKRIRRGRVVVGTRDVIVYRVSSLP